MFMWKLSQPIGGLVVVDANSVFGFLAFIFVDLLFRDVLLEETLPLLLLQLDVIPVSAARRSAARPLIVALDTRRAIESTVRHSN